MLSRLVRGKPNFLASLPRRTPLNALQYFSLDVKVVTENASSVAVAPKSSSSELSLYMRTLPSSCIDWNSEVGKRLFREALADETMQCYFPLAAQFTTQDEPAHCGFGTLSMILNALRIDPGRIWKGPWRWYHESMLETCLPKSEVKQNGLDLYDFVCLSRCNGTAVSLVRPPAFPTPPPPNTLGPLPAEDANTPSYQAGLQAFREHIDAVCSASPDANEMMPTYLVVSYGRNGLGQTGDGHFSPIGGYHRASDSVLLMDVARFKYPPHWVSVEHLYNAMRYIDVTTGAPRGFMTIRRSSSVPLVLFALGGEISSEEAVSSACSAGSSCGCTPLTGSSLSGGCANSGCGNSSRGNTSCNNDFRGCDCREGSGRCRGQCQGQGRAMSNADKTLHNVALCVANTKIHVEQGDLSGRLALSAAVDIAVDVILNIRQPKYTALLQAIQSRHLLNLNSGPNTNSSLFPSLSGGSETVSDGNANSGVSEMVDLLNGFFADSVSNAKQCLSRLSPEHLRSVHRLVHHLERSGVHALVERAIALRQPTASAVPLEASTSKDVPFRDGRSRRGRRSRLPAETHTVRVGSAGGVLHLNVLKVRMDTPRADLDEASDDLVESDAVVEAAIADSGLGSDVSVVQFSDCKTRECATTPCSVHSDSCVTVSTSHVVTLLLMALFSPSHANMRNPYLPNSSCSRPPAETETKEALPQWFCPSAELEIHLPDSPARSLPRLIGAPTVESVEEGPHYHLDPHLHHNCPSAADVLASYCDDVFQQLDPLVKAEIGLLWGQFSHERTPQKINV